MSYNDLQDFINKLTASGELIEISEPVDTDLEITEISRRVLANKGPAILFTNVTCNGKKGPYRVLTNLFGTVERVALGLGIQKDDLRALGQTLAFLKSPQPPKGLKEAWNYLPLAKKILSMKPKYTKSASCQEVCYFDKDIDINILPIQKCWPEDISPLITWPLVVTQAPGQEPKSIESYNIGIYRMQPIAPNKVIVRWLKHRGGAEHNRSWHAKDNGKRQPISAVIGSDPATILSAVLPLPENISEYNFSGLLREKNIELVKCKTNDLYVPANSEIVIEGYIDLNEYADEGPFGDHTGYYNEVEKFPVMTITAITMRNNPIYHSTYTGKPPDEPSTLGIALNELFIPLIKQQFPEITDFHLPEEGCSYRIAVVAIKKTYPGQAKRVMMGIWSFLRQFLYTKMVIVVDSNIDIRNWKEIMWAISTKFDPSRDLTLLDNTPMDYLDFASPVANLGGKIGIDATDKMPPETSREWGKEITMDQDIIEAINKKWDKFGFKF